MPKKIASASKHRNIPEPTIARLPRYLRSFAQFAHANQAVVSSKELAAVSDINPSQVRKDLAYFGQFGQRGIGYDVKTLDSKMREILGLHRAWRIALIGAGNLGTALLQYGGFAKAGFKIEAAFDVDPSKVGWELEGVKIWGIPAIRQVVREKKIEIGVIAVPASQAQRVADDLVDAGIRAILNFAPCALSVPKSVLVRGVDLASELEHLTYFLEKSRKSEK
ncbi:MAG TPA: redox-sensing transcriptional repressor Rex [bacterium]